jgi:hypothetical protein
MRHTTTNYLYVLAQSYLCSSVKGGALVEPLKPKLWISGFRLDLGFLVLAPLAIVPAVLLLLASGLTEQRELNAWVFAFGAQGHHLPGWLRAYGDSAVFQAYRRRLLIAPVVIVGLSVGFALLELQTLVLLAYLWGVWHGLMQTYGIARIYGRLGGVSAGMARFDLLLCQVGFIAAVLASDLRLHYIFDLAMRMGLTPPSAAALAVLKQVAVATFAVVAAAWLLAQFLTSKRVTHHPGRLLLLPVSLAFWWFCNLTVGHMLIGLALFEVFHDLQYLSLVWWVGRKRSADGAGGAPARLLYQRGPLSVLVYVIACALYGGLGAPGVAGSTLHQLGIGLLAASQLLHFYFDGFIWRLQAAENSTWMKSGEVKQTAHASRSLVWVVPLVAVLLFCGWIEGGTSLSDRERIVALSDAVPQSILAQMQRAQLELSGDSARPALAGFSKVLQRLPDYDLALTGRQRALSLAARRGLLADASAAECSLWRDAKLARLANDQGVAHAKDGRIKRAESAWKTALCLASDLSEASFNLAAMMANTGRLKQAAELLSEGLVGDPENAQARRLLRQVRERLGSAVPSPSATTPR